MTDRSAPFALADILALVSRRRWTVLLVLATVIAGAAMYTATREPQYRAESRVLVRTNVNQNLFPLGDTGGSRLVRFIPAELEYIESDQFERTARRASPAGIEVDVSIRSTIDGEMANVLSFMARGVEPVTVATAANEWAGTYVEQRHRIDREELTATIAALESTAQELRTQRETIVAPLQPLDDAISATSNPDTLARLTTQRLALLQGLNTELAPLESQLRGIEEQLASLEVDDSFVNDEETSARVVRLANPPQTPYAPSWISNMTIAALAAISMALGTAYTIDRLADRVNDTSEEAEALGLLHLATVPRARPENLTGQAISAGTAPATVEGFQQLVTSLEIILSDSDSSSLVVTSANQEEGKSTVATGIAAVLARQGLKVLLIDADMRRPTLHAKLDVANRRGLAALLEGSISFDDALLEPPELATLRLIPAGHPTTNPADLLRAGTLNDIVARARDQFDRVIIDAPPVLPVTDATPLARAVDLAVVVVRPGQTRRTEMAQAVERLRQSGAVVAGVVENGSRQRSADYETYGEDRT